MKKLEEELRSVYQRIKLKIKWDKSEPEAEVTSKGTIHVPKAPGLDIQ